MLIMFHFTLFICLWRALSKQALSVLAHGRKIPVLYRGTLGNVTSFGTR